LEFEKPIFSSSNHVLANTLRTSKWFLGIFVRNDEFARIFTKWKFPHDSTPEFTHPERISEFLLLVCTIFLNSPEKHASLLEKLTPLDYYNRRK
jgi:hypothetical protein